MGWTASAAATPALPLAVKYYGKPKRVGAHPERVRWQRSIGLRALLPLAAPASTATPAKPAKPALGAVDRAVLDRINAVRTRHGLRPLVLSAGLTAAARQHSLEMVRQGYFAHQSSDGSSFDRRIRRFYPRLRSAGENIAYGCPDLSPTAAMDLWMNSPGHRRNILDPRWREIGIAIVHADSASGPDYRGDATTVATTDFGLR